MLSGPRPIVSRAFEIWPYHEAADFAELPPERLGAPRDGERGSLGVA